MAKILCIETSTRICSVCISVDGKVISLKESNEPNIHAQMVHQYIETCMQECNLSFDDLSAVAVCRGPGSYTGLRIGVSAAKGIAYAKGIPLISVSTLKSLAWKSKQKSQFQDNILYCPMIDARRMEVYTAYFDKDLEIIKDVHALKIEENTFEKESEIHQLHFSGDGAEKCIPLFGENKQIDIDADLLPSAANMAELSNEQFKKKEFEDLAYFEPFYLKDFVPGISKVKGLRF